MLEHPGNQPLDALKAAGARDLHQRPADLAAASDVVILVLTGSPQVEPVLTGDGGVLQGLRPGTVVIDCSTAMPSSTQRMAQAVEAAGRPLPRHADDAHAQGSRRRAPEPAGGRRRRTAGGMPAAAACFAENITHAGPVGAGHSMKLLHNYVSLGFVTLLSEAAACAAHHDVAPEVFVEVLGKGGGGGTALERLRPYLTARDVSGLRFSVANACKDLGYYNTMATDGGCDTAVAAAVQATLDRANREAPQALMPELSDILAKHRNR